MAILADDLLLEVLKAVHGSAPAPFYPAAFAAYSGLKRDILDSALDQLRMRGLARLTDWAQGKGQGYALTSQGEAVLENPALLKHPPTPPPVDRPARDPADSHWARGEMVREALLNPVRPIVTTTLLAINIAVFLLDVVYTPVRPWAWMHPAEVLWRDQWWRLLSYAFVHGNLLHVAVNMYALYSLGPFLETMWGPARFLVLYTVGALAGGCATMLPPQTLEQMVQHLGPPTVGASGAICGLLTSFGVWVYLNRGSLPPPLVSSWMRAFMTNMFLMTIISFTPGISWKGHLGGALGGALVSVPLNFHRFGRGWQRHLGLVAMVAIPIFTVGLVLEGYKDTLKVRWLLDPALSAAEGESVDTLRAYALPLLNDWGAGKKADQARLAAARDAFNETQKHIQEALKKFADVGEMADLAVAGEVQQARAYLEEWSKYFAVFAKTLELAEPQTQTAPILRQWAHVVITHSRLGPAKLFTWRDEF